MTLGRPPAAASGDAESPEPKAKRTSEKGRAPFGARDVSGSEKKASGGLHVRSLGALGPLDHFERHALAFGQRLVALHRYRREVNEHVVATLTLDEAVALLVREPLHGPLWQNKSSLHVQATAPRASRRPVVTAAEE